MRRFDCATTEIWRDESGPADFHAGWASIHRAIGGEHIHGNLIVLPPQITSAQYHWEAGQEEWLIVLTGTPTVRHPEGEDELRPGDVAAFPAGPAGAHQVINRTDKECRVVHLSTVALPNVLVYPDTNKIGVDAQGWEKLLRGDGEVDYWEGVQ